MSLLLQLILLITLALSDDAFKWGTATASYQIEGAVAVDGRLPSIWDTFSAIPNKVHNNETGEIADDNYHRYKKDIQLMKDLNLTHYRLSFAWPRILPDGKTVNQKGIDHYTKVIDELLDAGIEPFVTLYHWDLPQSVYNMTNGGWINSSIVDYFELYAKTVFDNFHDKVKYWLTFNEPWTFCFLGYDVGVHAPGRCTNCEPDILKGNSSIEGYQCTHNVLLSHAAAVKYFRNQSYDRNTTTGEVDGQIGITLNVDWGEPASSSEADYNASQRRLIWALGWFADPIFFGDYPQIMKDYVGDRLPRFTDQQKQDLNGSHDFFGLNHYTTKWIKAVAYNASKTPDWSTDQRNYDSPCNQYNNTPIGIVADSSWLWDVPWGIYKMIKWIDNRYGNPPIYITENGCDVPNEDSLPLEEILNDTFRIRFYDGYISSVTKAKSEGSDIRGYFAWSLMDNFEWADGYSKRFGLHYVNYTKNLTRYAKNSAKWFSNYANILNPDASYIGSTLPEDAYSIPSSYAESVCPTVAPTSIPTSTPIPSTNENTGKSGKSISTLAIVFIIIGALIVVLLLAVLLYRCLVKARVGGKTKEYQNMRQDQLLESDRL